MTKINREMEVGILSIQLDSKMREKMFRMVMDMVV